MASGTLTGLIPTLYEALDIVSREAVGFIPAVAMNANAQRAAVGETIRIPVTGAGSAIDLSPAAYASDTTSESVSYADMTISKAQVVKVNWTGEEQKGYGANGTLGATLAQQFAQAMRTLTNAVESDLAGTYVSACRAYGSAGSAPFASTLAEAAQMGKILTDNGAPLANRNLVINTSAGVNLRSLANLNQVNTAGSDATLRGGILLPLSGFNIRESAQIASHTKGGGTSYVLDGSTAAGETTVAVDTGSGIVLAGDVVTFAADTNNKYVVNTGITEAGDVVLGKPGTQMIIPDSNAMTVGDSYTANMAFHKDAIQLIARMPAMPEGGDMADDVVEIFDPVSGLGFQVALYRQYHQVHYEIGLAWGVSCIKPEHCAILLG